MVIHEVNLLLSKLRPVTVEQIQRYTNLVMREFRAINLHVSCFEQWKDGGGNMNIGMRRLSQKNLAHGAVRLVKEHFISDGACLNDREVGFKRKIAKDEVAYLMKDSRDNVLAKVKFDSNLKETMRDDQYGFFADITS